MDKKKTDVFNKLVRNVSRSNDGQGQKKPRISISVIMPCYNEEKHIAKSLESLLDSFVQENCEILVIDGMSTDRTPEVVRTFIDRGFPVRLLFNANKLQVYALNQGIAESRGDIIVRTDAHSIYPPEYVQRCSELLETTGAANVGGVMQPRGTKTIQKAIALAMQHPVGVGDARYHLGKASGYVDTVYLGAFPRSIFDEVGVYDTNCRTNEDSELNLRILKAGRKIYLESTLRVTYTPRESFKDLAVQYFRYGKGRAYTTLKHKKVTSLRQVGPVVLVPALVLCLIIGLCFWKPLVLIVPLAYFSALLATSLLSLKRKKVTFKLSMSLFLAFAIMHLSWGFGFLSYLVFRRKSKVG